MSVSPLIWMYFNNLFWLCNILWNANKNCNWRIYMFHHWFYRGNLVPISFESMEACQTICKRFCTSVKMQLVFAVHHNEVQRIPPQTIFPDCYIPSQMVLQTASWSVWLFQPIQEKFDSKKKIFILSSDKK